MCLLEGIVEANMGKQDDEEKVLDLDSIAQNYAKWIYSRPFDIGQATQNALDPPDHNKGQASVY